MKQLSFLILFLFILGLTSFGQSGRQSKKALKLVGTETTEQQKILQIEEDLRKAKVDNNVQRIGEIFADEYKGLNQFGVSTVKAQGIANWVNNKNAIIILDSVAVTLIDDKTAIAKGLQTENGLQLRFERQYAKQDGNWRVIFNRQKLLEFKGTIGIGKFVINGTLAGGDGVAISLMKNVNGRMVNLNAAIVKDGTFKMEGPAIDFPDMVFLTTPGKNDRATYGFI
jgi:hypothetical protein